MSKQERPISQPSASGGHVPSPVVGTISEIWVREAIYLSMPGPILMSVSAKKHGVTMTETTNGVLIEGRNVKRLVPWSNVVTAGLL